MRTFGYAYLAAYLIDCLLSALSLLVPWIEGLSNAVSMLVLVSSLVALGLSSVGPLRPRRVFLPLSLYDLGMGAIGLVAGVALAFIYEPERVTQELATPGGLYRLLPEMYWVMWTLAAIWFILAVAGLLYYRTYRARPAARSSN